MVFPVELECVRLSRIDLKEGFPSTVLGTPTEMMFAKFLMAIRNLPPHLLAILTDLNTDSKGHQAIDEISKDFKCCHLLTYLHGTHILHLWCFRFFFS